MGGKLRMEHLERALGAFPEAKEALREILERNASFGPKETVLHVGEALGRYVAKVREGQDAREEAMIVLLYGAILADINEVKDVEVAEA